MEILKSFNEKQLDTLRDVFDSAPYSSLDCDSFKETIRRACRGKRLALTDEYLEELFASVDVSGRGRVGWSDFSMFAIEQANITEEDTLLLKRGKKGSKKPTKEKPKDGGKTSAVKRTGSSSQGPSPTRKGASVPRSRSDSVAAGADGEDSAEEEESDDEMELDIFSTFHPFSVDSVIPHPFGKQVNITRYFQKQKRLVMSMNDVKGSSHVTVYDVHDGGKGMSVHGRLPKQPEVIIDWDLIPVTGGVGFSNSLVCSYQGGVVQIFSLQKKRALDDTLPFCKSMNFSETQTCLVWSSLYNRLLLGSRGGVLSIWDVDGDTIFSQEKLHTEAITKLMVRNGTVFSSSLDRFNSVKTVDVEHSIVTNAFNDHMLGGATALTVSEDYLYSGGFESKIVQRSLQTPRAQPSFLYDSTDPHTGRLTCLELLPNSPMLMSSDSHGTVKVWDLRVGACLQTLCPSAAEGSAARQHKGKTSKHRGGGGESKRAPILPPSSAAGSSTATAMVTSGSGMQSSAQTATAAVESNVDVGCVSSICSIPKLGTVIVTNDTDMVNYTSLSSCAPELVDDQRACRFFLLPSPSQLLTVHERGVKLWRLDDGHLIYATDNDLVKADVSSCTVVSPLKRQFLLGTMEGEVKGFSVALGQPTLDMGAALQRTDLLGKEVLSLHVLPKFRDYSSPYVILTHDDGVTLCPMMENDFSSAVVRLHTLTALLDEGRFKVKESRLSEDMTRLLVSTTRNCAYLIDLAQVGVIVATYTVTASLENTVLSTQRSLCAFLSQAPPVEISTTDDEADMQRDADRAEEAAQRRLTISMLATSIVAQRRRQSMASVNAAPQRARSQSAIAKEAIAAAQHKRRAAYFQKLHAALEEDQAVVNSSRDGQEKEVGTGGTLPRQRETTDASMAIHRFLVAAADCQGSITLGYAQTVRRLAEHVVGQRAVSQAVTKAGLAGKPLASTDTLMEDSYPVLGAWCAAKNEPTWKWGPKQGGKVADGGGACARRQASPNNRPLHLSRKSRARVAQSGHSFLSKVDGPIDDDDGFSSPLLVEGDTTSSLFGPGFTSSGAWEGTSGSPTYNNTLVLDTMESRRASESTTLVPMSIRLRKSAMPVVTHMHYFTTLQLLVTGNEQGDVKVWDVAGVFLPGPRAAAPEATTSTRTAAQGSRYAPMLVHEWHAHKNGFTALTGIDHPHCHLPVILTTGTDRCATLWSLDGIALGTLATGRQLDDRSGGNRFALPPFRLQDCRKAESVATYWGHMLDYLMERGRVLGERTQPRRADGAPPSSARGFGTAGDVPPLSLTLTARTGRRVSNVGGLASPTRPSLNASQNSFFLTDGLSPPGTAAELVRSHTPTVSVQPRELDHTSQVQETTGGMATQASPAAAALVASAEASLSGTDAEVILAGLKEPCYGSPARSALRRRDGGGAGTPPSFLSPSPPTMNLLTSPREKGSRVTNKTARLARANRHARRSSTMSPIPCRLAQTGVTVKTDATAPTTTPTLPAISSRGAGPTAAAAAAAAGPQQKKRDWGAMPSALRTSARSEGLSHNSASHRAVSSPASLCTADRSGGFWHEVSLRHGAGHSSKGSPSTAQLEPSHSSTSRGPDSRKSRHQPVAKDPRPAAMGLLLPRL